ncbi:MAG TPA: TonB family protein, partial [Nevskia sp.]|nr:TonB family protein [Nevskia sp.]
PPPDHPPPPQQIVTNAPVTTPDVPTVPPPPPPPPPTPPPQENKVVTSWPPSYLSQITSKISENFRYPPKSVQNEEEGDAVVRIRMARDGTILGVELQKKTGFVALDAEARNVFDRIVKFPPVPADVFPEAASFEFTLPINFKLN